MADRDRDTTCAVLSPQCAASPQRTTVHAKCVNCVHIVRRMITNDRIFAEALFFPSK